MTRIIGGCILGIVLMGARAGAEDVPLLKTEKDKISYAVGVDVATNFKMQEIEVNLDLLIQGLKDGFGGKPLLMSDKDIRKVTQAVQAEVRRKMIMNQRTAANDNRLKEVAFLGENKAKEGVVSLASGVQYKILKEGTGKKPTDTDEVECSYRGTLLDGAVFDSTEPGKSATLKVSQMILGWREAMKLMPVGSTWRVVVPSSLGYGERGFGKTVGPNATLIFEVELLAIK